MEFLRDFCEYEGYQDEIKAVEEVSEPSRPETLPISTREMLRGFACGIRCHDGLLFIE
jgi:hypothetical protein